MFGRRTCGQLLELDTLRRASSVSGQAPLGVRTIPLASIIGDPKYLRGGEAR